MQGGTTVYSSQPHGTQSQVQPSHAPVLHNGTKKPLPPQKSLPSVPSPRPDVMPTTIVKSVTQVSALATIQTSTGQETKQIKVRMISDEEYQKLAQQAIQNPTGSGLKLYEIVGPDKSTTSPKITSDGNQQIGKGMPIQKTGAVAASQLPTTIPTNAKTEDAKLYDQIQRAKVVKEAVVTPWPKSGSAKPNIALEESLKKAVEKNPVNENDVRALSQYYFSIEAENQIKNLLTLCGKRAHESGDMPLSARVGTIIAEWHLAKGTISSLNAAAHIFERSATLDPARREYYHSLAVTSLRKRDELEAVKS